MVWKGFTIGPAARRRPVLQGVVVTKATPGDDHRAGNHENHQNEKDEEHDQPRARESSGREEIASDRSIAAKTYISIRAVHADLRHIYAKPGVTRPAELTP
jgi:hypothetical protein